MRNVSKQLRILSACSGHTASKILNLWINYETKLKDNRPPGGAAG